MPETVSFSLAVTDDVSRHSYGRRAASGCAKNVSRLGPLSILRAGAMTALTPSSSRPRSCMRFWKVLMFTLRIIACARDIALGMRKSS